jgi:acyl-CoA reductase-like NAD-dependent aldehyde dehydrogenase
MFRAEACASAASALPANACSTSSTPGQARAARLPERIDEAAALITLESGLCRNDKVCEVGRVCDVLTFGAVEALRDDGQTFTGGAAVGKAIAAKAGYRRLMLELGGHDPVIAMDNADLEEFARLAAQGSYKNSGQRCTAGERMLVHEKVADELVERLVDEARD